MVPSEMKLSKAWDACIERIIYRTVISTAVAGMAAVVLFRKCCGSISYFLNKDNSLC